MCGVAAGVLGFSPSISTSDVVLRLGLLNVASSGESGLNLLQTRLDVDLPSRFLVERRALHAPPVVPARLGLQGLHRDRRLGEVTLLRHQFPGAGRITMADVVTVDESALLSPRWERLGVCTGSFRLVIFRDIPRLLPL